jgi:hypothetical protein
MMRIDWELEAASLMDVASQVHEVGMRCGSGGLSVRLVGATRKSETRHGNGVYVLTYKAEDDDTAAAFQSTCLRERV